MYRCNTKPHFWSQLWLGIIAIFSVSVNAQPTPATQYRQVYHISQQCVHTREQHLVHKIQTQRTLPALRQTQPHLSYASQHYYAPINLSAPIRAGPAFA
ncbi:DUF2547 family protein [Pasteurellaceae bacterium HPA106]|uniref:secA translation regulator SecM n=1 Tax=Spirabiliibacterium pneumoniae TaxID=221400 RepID=UPI001AAD8922|nr:secA translation regulator SecM [Spirabiliibacterium pneumoniae]MBE2895504.1 DUF2547 family protein [Spirabiliibacterium pneumoniae]